MPISIGRRKEYTIQMSTVRKVYTIPVYQQDELSSVHIHFAPEYLGYVKTLQGVFPKLKFSAPNKTACPKTGYYIIEVNGSCRDLNELYSHLSN